MRYTAGVYVSFVLAMTENMSAGSPYSIWPLSIPHHHRETHQIIKLIIQPIAFLKIKEGLAVVMMMSALYLSFLWQSCVCGNCTVLGTHSALILTIGLSGPLKHKTAPVT